MAREIIDGQDAIAVVSDTQPGPDPQMLEEGVYLEAAGADVTASLTQEFSTDGGDDDEFAALEHVMGQAGGLRSFVMGREVEAAELEEFPDFCGNVACTWAALGREDCTRPILRLANWAAALANAPILRLCKLKNMCCRNTHPALCLRKATCRR